MPNGQNSNGYTMQSQTYGGYGPVPIPSSKENDFDTEEKTHGKKLATSISSFIIRFLRRFGCSNYEMLKNEGENGAYYRDSFNDESWSCSIGTGEGKIHIVYYVLKLHNEYVLKYLHATPTHFS